ncbi:WbqC family protein [Daejeonella oryzae]|uniref:WbqC family protein n=1 Tax=Daejeonella oryzae TaxID=1122943 RepID=UPI002852CE62|nr:WbqC family protein [Daejeonella oryzae]
MITNLTQTMEKGALLPLFYLPPIEFFSRLVKHKENVLIEKFEHFPKQTYRNRASIHSPNGKLDLIVPVVKGSNVHTSIKDVKISYDFKWQRQHLMSLQTSYRNSAYYEFYEDNFMPFYEKKWDFLFDYNEQLLELLIKSLKIKVQYNFTESYEKAYEKYIDFRENIHPKHSSAVPIKPYFQVFEERNGFIENLSIVDLLFNQGPQSLNYLL